MTRVVIDRNAFLKKVERPKEDVPVPEMGNGTVVPVWGMTVRERAAFEKQFQGKGGKTIANRTQELRERLIIECCRNDDGKPLFEQADISAIGSLSACVVERIVSAAMRLSGMSDNDVEDLAKN